MSKFSSAALLTILGLVTSGARADAVLDWNDVTLAEVTASGQLPPDGARTMAMVHVAVFDALNAIDRRYEPVALAERGPEGASTDAAAASASYTVLAALFPSREQRLAEAYAAALARVPDGHAAGIHLYLHRCADRRHHSGSRWVAGLPRVRSEPPARRAVVRT